MFFVHSSIFGEDGNTMPEKLLIGTVSSHELGNVNGQNLEE